MNDSDLWFHIQQDRKREKLQRLARAQRRAQRAARREAALQRAFIDNTTPKIKMQVTEWVTDELGNLSRKVYQE